jgi:hypothetical protein
MQTLIGILFHRLFGLFYENRMAIHPAAWPKAAFLLLLSVRNSTFHRIEQKRYAQKFEQVNVRPDPVFILGHWRSGTTILHKLMSLDENFSYPNIFQIYNPNTFLVTMPILRERLEKLKGQKRPMDRMKVRYNDPGEEEFAVSVMCLRSPVLSWVFPNNQTHYNRFLTFKSASQIEIDEWKQALLLFMKKLSVNNDQPILLKSPQNTARIRLLLELFPNARFIHIHRNPFHTFRSTQSLYENTVTTFHAQKNHNHNLQNHILDQYNEMYDAFFEQRCLIPSANYTEISFEKLEQDYVRSLEFIYESLNLNGFAAFKPRLEKELAGYKSHKKNDYQALEADLRQNIVQSWSRNFDEWKYPCYE